MKRNLAFVALASAVFIMTPRSDAAPVLYYAALSGPNESPANASPGTGISFITIDPVAHTLRVQTLFSGLLGPTTASHIHTPTPSAGSGVSGVATQTPSFSAFPLGVTSGSMDQTLDTTLASTYNATFVTANGGTPAGAEAALFSGIRSGQAYLNIHTAAPNGFPGGEIRGFIQAAPEPTTLTSACLGLAGLVGYSRLRRKRSVR